MNPTLPVPVLGFAAFGEVGKTSLLKKLMPLLKQRGLRLGLIKHSHHPVEIDRPGKDSYILRKAGALQMLVASAHRTVLIVKQTVEPSLEDIIDSLKETDLDLILVEGFKHGSISKIELHRPNLGHPLLCLDDPAIIAVAADAPPKSKIIVPLLDLNDPVAIADFIGIRFFSPRR